MQNNSINLHQVEKIQQWQKIIIYFMVAIAFFTLWASLYAPIYDGDIWFHLLYGKAILENHSLVPDHTIYSWTPSTNENIYCAWIGQIIYYLLFKYFGNGGVIVLRYLAATSLFIAILNLSRQRNTFYNPITWFAASLCTLIISQVSLDKPEIMTFMLMTLIVWIWYKIKQIKGNALYHIYSFPLLIIVWVNTHGGFIYGCLFLLCVGLGETFNQFIYRQNALPRNKYWHLLIALFLSAWCIFITPYGHDYIYQLAMQYFDKQMQSDIINVQAYISTFLLKNNPQLTIFANIATGIILVVFSISLHKKQLDFVPIISNLLFAYLFTLHGRLIIPWISVFSLSIAYYCSSISVTQTREKIILFAALPLATFLLSGWLMYHERMYPSREQWLEFGISEKCSIDEEIDFIKNNYNSSKLANMYDHGAYILWKMWPQAKVMMDARYFPYKNWFNEFLVFRSGVNVESFIKKYPFDVIAVQHTCSKLIQWFYRSNDWKLVFYGKNAAVFVRSSLAPSQIIRGKNLNDIRTFTVAAGVFNTSILIKDWVATDIILNTMKRNFINQHQKLIISGLEDVKQSSQMYEQKNYTGSISFSEKSFKKQVFYHDLYAASLLMKAIEDWKQRNWSGAIKNTFNSLQAQKSFAATYNLALMAWQIEAMELDKQGLRLPLTDQEKEITVKWRNILYLLVQNKDNLPQDYAPFIENASKILNGDKDCKTQLLTSDYQ